VTTRFKQFVAALLVAASPVAHLFKLMSAAQHGLVPERCRRRRTGQRPHCLPGPVGGLLQPRQCLDPLPAKDDQHRQPPAARARAGCGGIDIFAGSFSFINASEIVAMLKAVANNAVGFAFSLAIDTVCPECSKIMQEFSQKAQLMNNLNINSCELAQGLVGGIWPKGDLADKAICEAIGNSEGIFTDYAAAKHGCGTRGQRSSTTNCGRGQVRRRQSRRAAQLHLDDPQEVGVLFAGWQVRPASSPNMR
jgi:conjugative transfer pilus assembly protein TraH